MPSSLPTVKFVAFADQALQHVRQSASRADLGLMSFSGLDATGLGWRRRNFKSLPQEYSCSLVVLLDYEPADDRVLHLAFRLLDPAGKVLWERGGGIGAIPNDEFPVQRFPVVVGMDSVTYETTGDHTLVIDIDGQEAHREVLEVRCAEKSSR